MISRDFGDGGWKATGRYDPPPLHVTDTESAAAAWFPLRRPVLRATPPGPVMVHVPAPGGFAGDDPTDPAAQTVPRRATLGMVGRLHAKGVSHR